MVLTSWRPVEMVADREFDKKVIHEHMNKRGIKFLPLPARRHYKAGIVERKNRVLKDILERFELDDIQKSKTFQEKLSNAGYISNIMYGNRVASSFELVRGYTPSLNATGQLFVSGEYLEVHKAMTARGILARIMRSRPEYIRGDIAVREMVLVIVPNDVRKRGHWKEERVLETRQDGSVVVGQGRQQKFIAREDVRKLPSNTLAGNVVRAQYEMPAKRHHKSEVHYMEEDVDSDTTEANSDDSDVAPTKNSKVLSVELKEGNQKAAMPTTEQQPSTNSVSGPSSVPEESAERPKEDKETEESVTRPLRRFKRKKKII
ncbi:hypothetical protein FGB62_224g07 [Gracilaria domingensis]|nr:hypothetical protein FGB62_224g07 [Gracilaria domingensis]